MNSVYIHIPFCIRKCFYCDFYSEENDGVGDEFVGALCREIAMRSDLLRLNRQKLNTLFLGGGTPSLLAPEQLERIFEALRRFFKFTEQGEITMECNPGTISPEKLKEFRQIGINRLSIGVQSFNKKELKFLQRIHSAEEAEKSVFDARAAGFDNINLDLIFAIPGQTAETLNYSIKKAAGLGAEHIAAYSLIYEEGTPLYESWKKGLVRKTNDTKDAKLYSALIDSLEKAGYKQYEVSNFAKSGKKCRHNLNYWRCGEYISFGPAAHGYIGAVRYWNINNLEKYIDLIKKGEMPERGREILGDKERLFERIILGLRSEGVNLKEIKEEFKTDLPAALKARFESWEAMGYIKIREEKISLTKTGYPICDEITSIILAKI